MPTLVSTGQITITDQNDYIFTGTTPPTNPIVGLTLWIDTSVTPNLLKRWTGSAWAVVNDYEINGRNLFVISTLTKGSYLVDTGSVIVESLWGMTDFIPVTAGGKYIASGYINLGTAPSTCFYDLNKSFVSGIRNNNSGGTPENDQRRIVTIPAGCSFMRFSFELRSIQTIKLEKGDTATAWSPSPEDVYSMLDDIASDNKFTPHEKQATKKEWDIIVSEYSKNIAQADSLKVSRTVYTATYTTLSNYITPLLANLTTTSDIVGTTFRNNFLNYYNAKTDLQNAIQTRLSDVQVGGRNYLLDSTFKESNTFATFVGSLTMALSTDMAYMGTRSIRATNFISGVNMIRINWPMTSAMVLSFFVNSPAARTIRVYQTDSSWAVVQAENYQLTTGWNRVTHKLVAHGDRILFGLTGTFNASDVLYFDAFKLENGNTVTDWTPAPEDAHSKLDDIANDNKFTPDEKQAIKKEWDAIASEYPKNIAQADSLGVSRTVYAATYTTLSNYITPLLANLTTTSDIVGTTFRNNFLNYYNAKTDLQNAIQTRLSDVQVGGRNYLPDSTFKRSNQFATLVGALTMSLSNDMAWIGNQSLKASNFQSGVRMVRVDWPLTEIFVFSFYVYTSVARTIRVYQTDSTWATMQNVNYDLPVGWSRVKHRLLAAGDRILFGLTGTFNASDVLYFDAFKLETGNIATDWTPSPDDVDTEINEISIGGDNLLLSPTIDLVAGQGENFKFAVLKGSGSSTVVSPSPYLENGKTYVFTATQIERLAGTATGVSLLLYDFVANGGSSNLNQTLSFSSSSQSKVFSVPSTGNWTLIIYAGISGSTAGNTVRFTKLMLQEGNKPTAFKPATEYISEALLPDPFRPLGTNTSLLWSKLLLLRDEAGTQRGGMSGISDPIGFWTGGTYDEALANVAKAIIRKDGSGQLAGGNINWDTAGNLQLKGLIEALGGRIGGLNIFSNSLSSASMKFSESPVEGLASLLTPSSVNITRQFYWTSNTEGYAYTQNLVLPNDSELKFKVTTSANGTDKRWDVRIDDSLGNSVYRLQGNGEITDQIFTVNLPAGTYTIKAYSFSFVSLPTLPEHYVNLKGFTTDNTITATGYVSQTKIGNNGFYSFWSNALYMYFSAAHGFVMRGNVDIPNGLGGAEINSSGAVVSNSWWGEITAPGNISKSGNNYTITHNIGDTNYSVIITPGNSTPGTYYFSSKQSNTIVITCAGAFSFVLIRTQ